MHKFYPATLLCALLLSGCSPEDPQQHTSRALSEGVLIPSYSAWHQANQTLTQGLTDFCDAKQSLADTQQQFSQLQSRWAALQPFAIGPLAENNLAWQVQFWPDKKNLVARQTEALISTKPELTEADLAKASVVVRGLTALEYVLFDQALDLTQDAQRQRYCPLLTSIGRYQSHLSEQVLSQWQAPQGFGEQLSQYPNDRYADSQEAIAELLRSQITSLDALKKKLATPMGKLSKGIAQPLQAEAWRSSASLANIAASLAAAEQLWLGSQEDGLRQLLNEQQAEVAQRVDQAFNETRSLLASLKQPLGELLKQDSGRAQLEALYAKLNQLHRLHENELAPALGIQLGFNAHDGD